jgi:predicted RNA-binding protein
MRKLLIFGLIAVLASCGSDSNSVTDLLGNGHFRGHNIGDKRQQVENSLKGIESLSQTETSLNYEQVINGVELVSRYDFDQDALYSIQADLFFPDSSTLNSFQNQLIKHYNSQYGEVDMDSGFLVWQESGEVEFTLADESVEFGQPKLSLTIYNFDY